MYFISLNLICLCVDHANVKLSELSETQFAAQLKTKTYLNKKKLLNINNIVLNKR